jgi:hypothetical protein
MKDLIFSRYLAVDVAFRCDRPLLPLFQKQAWIQIHSSSSGLKHLVLLLRTSFFHPVPFRILRTVF